MKDIAITVATRALLALAWLCALIEVLAGRAGVLASREAVALSQRHTAAWRVRREQHHEQRARMLREEL